MSKSDDPIKPGTLEYPETKYVADWSYVGYMIIACPMPGIPQVMDPREAARKFRANADAWKKIADSNPAGTYLGDDARENFKVCDERAKKYEAEVQAVEQASVAEPGFYLSDGA